MFLFLFFQVPFPKVQTERWGLGLLVSHVWDPAGGEPLDGRVGGGGGRRASCARLYTFADPSIQHLGDRKPARSAEPESQIKKDHSYFPEVN